MNYYIKDKFVLIIIFFAVILFVSEGSFMLIIKNPLLINNK